MKDLRRQLAIVMSAQHFDAYSAGELSRKILALDASHSDEWAIRARALLEQKYFPGFDAAIAAWEKSVQPRAAQIEDLLGDKEAKQGRRKEAIEHWTAYVKQNSLDLAARESGWRKLTTALGAEGRWVEARDRYSDWIQANKDNPEPRLGRVAANEQLRAWKDRDNDIDWLNRNQPDSIAEKGLVLIANRKTIEDWNAIVAKAPRNTAARLGRAVALTRERQFKAALDDIRQRVEKIPMRRASKSRKRICIGN